MPEPPPQGPSRGRGSQNLQASFHKTQGVRKEELLLPCFVVHSSVYCAILLIVFNVLIAAVILDSLSLVSVEAAVLQDKDTYKTYLGRTKSSPSNDYSDLGKDRKWIKTDIKFLTKIKDVQESPDVENLKYNSPPGRISASDFHIIELEAEREKGNPAETLRIHLTRKASVAHPQLRVVVRNENETYEWTPSKDNSVHESCHYVGHVTDVPKRSKGKRSPSNATDEPNKNTSGLAVFSACPPSHGFSGLIIMDDGRNWYIEPSIDAGFTNRHKRDTSENLEILDHVLIPRSHLADHLANHVSDALRVPLAELEEAALLAGKDWQARRSVRRAAYVSSDWDDDPSLESLQSESSILTPFFYSGISLPFFGRAGDHKVSHAKKLGSSRKSGGGGGSSVQTTLLTPVESVGGSRKSYTTTTTTASSTTTKETASASVSSASVENLGATTRPLSRVVEIAVFTDEDLYNKMKAKFSVDPKSQLKEYATTMVNMMDVMYQHSSLGSDLRFRLVYMEVMEKKPSDLKTHGGKAKAYLSSFCDYAGEKNVNSAQWDHALLLTGLDLHEEGVKTTAGLAWAGTMCFRYYSCSISEGLNFASAYITTHEIGHSLGMEHDGVGISESCDSTKYIMSPTTGPGKVTWSTCSASNLQDFIKFGTSELRGKGGKNNFMISRPVCLEEMVSNRGSKSFSFGNPGKSGDGGGLETESDLKLPGEKYDANFQCSLGMGSFFKPHFERHKAPFDNICWILYCGNGTHAISTHPALEGTPCDRKKYCRSGQCVKRPESTAF